MRRADVSGTIGFCLSLLLHGTAALLLTRAYIGDQDNKLRQGGLRPSGDVSFLVPPASGLGEEKVKDLLGEEEEELDRFERMGQAEGRGMGANAAAGERKLHAREGSQEQAWLSRDPVGPNRRLPEEPSPFTGLPGMGGDGRRPSLLRPAPGSPRVAFGAAPGMPAAPPRLPLRAPAAPQIVPVAPPAQPPDVIGLASATQPSEQRAATTQSAVVVAMIPAVPAAPPQPAEKTAPRSSGGSGPAGPHVAPADPAPQSDSDSDPFSQIGSITFLPGRVDARLGCKVKTFKPRLSIKAEVDLATLRNPTIVLKLQIDAEGNVTEATVLKSSGSNEVDLPTRRAMYRWWFEPKKDKDGRPMPRVQIVTIRWYT